MKEFDILNMYLRIRFHFTQGTKYNSEMFYPHKTLDKFRKYVDVYFLEKQPELVVSMFCVWLFYSHKNNHSWCDTKKLFESEDFKKFLRNMKQYKDKMNDDFVKIYNIRNVQKIKQLMYRNKIHPVTFYVIMNTLYRHDIKNVESSNVFSPIWEDIKLLNYFIRLDKEFVRNYVNKLKER